MECDAKILLQRVDDYFTGTISKTDLGKWASKAYYDILKGSRPGDAKDHLTLNRYNYCISSYTNYMEPSGNLPWRDIVQRGTRTGPILPAGGASRCPCTVSGAAIFGGSPKDPGMPVTHEDISCGCNLGHYLLHLR